MTEIVAVFAREILDSRGVPTVEADVILSGGSRGRAAVPSGASTGRHEAVEFRDADPSRYRGNGVRGAVGHIQNIIAPSLIGMDALSQAAIDQTLLTLDSSPNKSRLGANTILAVSLASARAAAAQLEIPLFVYLGGATSRLLPVPMVNLINGGVHADNTLEIQEFMVVPKKFSTFADALRASSEIFSALKELLRAKGHGTSVGDEGGFAPDLPNTEAALEILVNAIGKAGYKAGEEVAVALDVAASRFYRPESQSYFFEGATRSVTEMVSFYLKLCQQYPIYSIEDALAEDDWVGWQQLTQSLGGKTQLVGDDLFVTNQARLTYGIQQGVANAILIKPNQIGTLTETMDVIRQAQQYGYRCIISHRSGETEDTFIADLAVAVSAGQIKAGSVCRSERTAKYNRLLRIEEKLGATGIFAGKNPNFSLSKLRV